MALISQHETLFEMTISASNKNKIMMSNADVPLIRKHLTNKIPPYTSVVSCRRAINSKNPAAKTNEVILTNYQEEQ